MEDYEYVPVFSEETDEFLVLRHDCAAIECAGITLLSKKNKNEYFLIAPLRYENLPEGIFVAGGSWSSATREYQVVDLFQRNTLYYSFAEDVFLDAVFIDEQYRVNLIAFGNELQEGKKVIGKVKLTR